MSGTPSVRAVIFDLDGTIAETLPMAILMIGTALAENGGDSMTSEQVLAMFGPNEIGIFKEVLGDRWEAAWDWYLSHYAEMHSMCPAPFDGIEALIERLHGAGSRIGLVTGKAATTGRMSLEYLGLLPFFHGIEGGSETGMFKARAIAKLLRQWDLKPESAAYVGDTPNDVVEAKKAGVVAIAGGWSGFADQNALVAAEPDFLFENVDDLTSWLDEASDLTGGLDDGGSR